MQHAAAPATATEPEATRSLEDHLSEALEESEGAGKRGKGKGSKDKGAKTGSGSWLEQQLSRTVERDVFNEVNVLYNGEDEVGACRVRSLLVGAHPLASPLTPAHVGRHLTETPGARPRELPAPRLA